jgi:hypothetical protein
VNDHIKAIRIDVTFASGLEVLTGAAHPDTIEALLRDIPGLRDYIENNAAVIAKRSSRLGLAQENDA